MNNQQLFEEFCRPIAQAHPEITGFVYDARKKEIVQISRNILFAFKGPEFGPDYLSFDIVGEINTRKPGYYKVIWKGTRQIAQWVEFKCWDNVFIWTMSGMKDAFKDSDFDSIDDTPIDLTPRMSAEEKIKKIFTEIEKGNSSFGTLEEFAEALIYSGKSIDDLCKEYRIDTEVKM